LKAIVNHYGDAAIFDNGVFQFFVCSAKVNFALAVPAEPDLLAIRLLKVVPSFVALECEDAVTDCGIHLNPCWVGVCLSATGRGQ
jgi:hypothetical protein